MQSRKDDEIEHIHTLREAGAGKTSERTCSLGDTTFSLVPLLIKKQFFETLLFFVAEEMRRRMLQANLLVG